MAVVQYIAAIEPVTEPVCTVCIANYNGVAVLRDCIDSVLAQRGIDRVEIIVHDDASTDDSVAFLRANYPQVEILASDENVGFCVGNNRMVAHARGQCVLLLNNDAALFSDALQVLMANAKAQSPQGILTLPQYDWSTGELVDRGCLLDPFCNPVPNLDPNRSDVAYVIGACLFIPRALWVELGGFPEWMESIAEDMYLCCAARLRGLPVQVAVTSGYRHHQGASFGGNKVASGRLSTTYRRRVLSERNKIFVMIVCYPAAALVLLLPLHAAFLAVEALFLLLTGAGYDKVRQIYARLPTAIWCRLHDLAELRSRLQRQKRCMRVHLFAQTNWWPRKLAMLFRHGVPMVR